MLSIIAGGGLDTTITFALLAAFEFDLFALGFDKKCLGFDSAGGRSLTGQGGFRICILYTRIISQQGGCWVLSMIVLIFEQQ